MLYKSSKKSQKGQEYFTNFLEHFELFQSKKKSKNIPIECSKVETLLYAPVTLFKFKSSRNYYTIWEKGFYGYSRWAAQHTPRARWLPPIHSDCLLLKCYKTTKCGGKTIP